MKYGAKSLLHLHNYLIIFCHVLKSHHIKLPCTERCFICGHHTDPSQTSICILRCCLKLPSNVRKIAKESSNTCGTEEAPFLDSATHRYCLMALMNISLVRNTGPASCRMDSNSCRERILERSSWDLASRGKNKKEEIMNGCIVADTSDANYSLLTDLFLKQGNIRFSE